MRILFVVNTYPDENNMAVEPFVKAQIDSVRKTGIDVEIFNVRGGKSKLNYLKSVRRVQSLVRREPFDLVHGHYVYSGWLAALQRKVPSVVSFMGSDLYGGFRKDGSINFQGRMDIFISKAIQYLVDGIIVKSQDMQNLLIKKEKSLVIPNGVNFDVFFPTSKDDARQSLDLDVKKKYILFAGNQKSPRKGFDILDNAFQMLKEADPSYELLLVTNVAYDMMPVYMNAADVLALPSMREGSPNVVKEALACNLPVVSTDVGDVREVFANIFGCRIAKRTPESFSQAIQEVLSNDQPFEGRKGIDYMKIEKIAKRLVAFYEEVIKRKSQD